MAKMKYPKLAKAFATEFTPKQISMVVRNFGQGGDPRAIGSGCGNGCGSGCGNNCRRAVGFVFDEFGYLNITSTEMAKAAHDRSGLKRSVESQIAAFLR